ncbi:hypothetical protein [Alteribacter aurantiacus]|uniref:hypothetical protein n=1 Tax=Alteribacter aurantiacus TaxID=254410 RepID=UPI00040205C9|nr:hypothetical protein [Alteribacter aurantiacus]
MKNQLIKKALKNFTMNELIQIKNIAGKIGRGFEVTSKERQLFERYSSIMQTQQRMFHLMYGQQ